MLPPDRGIGWMDLKRVNLNCLTLWSWKMSLFFFFFKWSVPLRLRKRGLFVCIHCSSLIQDLCSNPISHGASEMKCPEGSRSLSRPVVQLQPFHFHLSVWFSDYNVRHCCWSQIISFESRSTDFLEITLMYHLKVTLLIKWYTDVSLFPLLHYY